MKTRNRRKEDRRVEGEKERKKNERLKRIKPHHRKNDGLLVPKAGLSK